MTNLTKEEFYRAAEDKSQFEAFVEKVIDNLPEVIDLHGAKSGDAVPGLYSKVHSPKKPVILTNWSNEATDFLEGESFVQYVGFSYFEYLESDAEVFGTTTINENGSLSLSVALAITPDNVIHIFEI